MAEETVTVAATPEVSIPFKFKLVAEGENMVTVLPCTCPACILANILREQATEEVEDEEIGDEDYEFEFELETQISENTGSRLDFADDFEDSLQSDPRTRRPARNQGGRSAKPKPKPHERIHHRDLKRKNEEQAARAERASLPVAVFGTQRSDFATPVSASTSWSQSQSRLGLPFNRADATANQQRRNDPLQDAARAHGAPLLSAAALGLDEATYQTLINLQFREINPNDYATLSVLDESVAPKSLDRRKLNLFPTKRVVQGPSGLQVVDTSGNVGLLCSENCIVCMDSFEVDDELRHLSCGHSFHRECIDEWFERSTKCPTDNVEIQ
eukprot:m.265093 g.265093  ORF g.265093 m.265093 type:complete len:328 (-) comp54678_c0_seq23:126-1109(-)